MGWKFRGQDPPTGRSQIIFINELDGALESTQRKWMRNLTASVSYFIDLEDQEGIESKINQQATILIKWSEVIDDANLVWLLKKARECKVKISACAWDSTHKAIKFHSQFNPSPYTERDMNYLKRFFIYFKKV